MAVYASPNDERNQKNLRTKDPKQELQHPPLEINQGLLQS